MSTYCQNLSTWWWWVRSKDYFSKPYTYTELCDGTWFGGGCSIPRDVKLDLTKIIGQCDIEIILLVYDLSLD